MTRDELTFEEYFSTVLSNSSEETVDRLLAAWWEPNFVEVLCDAFYEHPQPCPGGYSEERCPCAWGLRALHVMLVMIEADEWRVKQRLAEAFGP